MKHVKDLSEQPLSSINLAIWLDISYQEAREPTSGAAMAGAPRSHCMAYVGSSEPPRAETSLPPATVKWGKRERVVEEKI